MASQHVWCVREQVDGRVRWASGRMSERESEKLGERVGE